MRRLTALSLLATALVPSVAQATTNESDEGTTLAIFGDSPYGPAQLEQFPELVASINKDRSVRVAVHVGDIKSGSTRCDDSYFMTIRGLFGGFRRSLVYTPGDNEWTDCHRANNGAYVPTERLAKVREVFYPRAGRSLGKRPLRVLTQAEPKRLADELEDEGAEAPKASHPKYVENQMWKKADVVFSTAHVVGSNNNLAPWFGATAPGAEQQAEYDDRMAANLDWIDTTFDRAEADDAAGVVLAHQADMWDVSARTVTGFDRIVQKIADRSAEFGKPVLLLEGDSHAFIADTPLANGSPRHGVTTAAPNVTRIVVQGSADFPLEWLKLTVDPDNTKVFTWSRVLV